MDRNKDYELPYRKDVSCNGPSPEAVSGIELESPANQVHLRGNNDKTTDDLAIMSSRHGRASSIDAHIVAEAVRDHDHNDENAFNSSIGETGLVEQRPKQDKARNSFLSE